MLPQRAQNSAEPIWRQLETALLEQIRQGQFGKAGRLPSEHELADRFGVNRHTARQALAGLVQRGVVFKRKGGGSYIVPEIIDYEIGKRTRFSTNVMLQGREPSHTILEVAEREAQDRICAVLGMSAGEMVVFIQTIGEADGIPISVGETYLSARRFPGFGAIYRETMSTTKALAHFGVEHYMREVTRVTARNPSQDDVRNLRQPATTPVLAVESVDVDADLQPIVYHETRFAAERVQFVVKRGDDFD